jgi:hypothetical protein
VFRIEKRPWKFAEVDRKRKGKATLAGAERRIKVRELTLTELVRMWLVAEYNIFEM